MSKLLLGSNITAMNKYDQIIEISNEIKYMADIPELTPLPSNAIIYKTLPGLGATWNATKEQCNSIILLPNVATVVNKQSTHQETDGTFAVHEGVLTKHIVKYLEREDLKFKKLLVVPESFIKVKRAMKLLRINMHKEYRIILDECQKYTKDVDYRENILIPLNDFFLFDSKVMISATPLSPTDPRFTENGFKNIKVQPDYNFKKQLDLIYTSSLLETLKAHFLKFPNNHYFIFFNSVNGIKSIIEKLEIADNSKIFCSKDSKKQLASENIKNVFSEFTEATELATYNFLTSSFNTGLDIIMDTVPEVIIISDPQHADFSIVDPFTDVIQIGGRFRKECKIDRLTHIVQKLKEFTFFTQEEAEIRLSTSKDIYQLLDDLSLSATHNAQDNWYKEMQSRVYPYACLLNMDATINHFKKDNYFDEEKTKSYYGNMQNLISAYDATEYFNVDFKEHMYTQKEDQLVYRGNRYSKEHYKNAIHMMLHISSLEGCEGYDDLVFEHVEKHWPEAVDAFYNLPLETIVIKHDFNRRAIKEELIKKYAEQGKNQHAVIDAIYNSFSLNQKYSREEIKLELQRIFDLFGVTAKAKATDIKRYYEASPAKKKVKKEWQRAFIFTRRELNQHHLIQRR